MAKFLSRRQKVVYSLGYDGSTLLDRFGMLDSVVGLPSSFASLRFRSNESTNLLSATTQLLRPFNLAG